MDQLGQAKATIGTIIKHLEDMDISSLSAPSQKALKDSVDSSHQIVDSA